MSWDANALAAAEQLALPSFTSDDAFQLGLKIRERIQAHPGGRAAIVDIRTAGGAQLFFATSGPGTQLDNAHWAARKRASVLRFGKSTASLNAKWSKEGKIPDFFGASEVDYAIHGGGFPVRVKGVEAMVGTIVVSGLAQEDDHQVIVDALEEYIKEAAGKQQ
ncbi:hypothetical protein JCM10213_000886 [Rhodosporidiobolus nylandii]